MSDTIEANAIRIYAACLASYNSGRLHGAWIDCEGKSASELQNEINDMLARSPYPNVMRRKCPDCGTYQTDARPYRENEDECDECGATLPDEFKPSAEEWAIHDHEGFCGLIRSEWPDLEDVAAIAEALADDDDDKRRGLVWLVDSVGYSVSDALDKCEDVRTFNGTAEEYAAELLEDSYSDALDKLPDLIRNHIDYEGIARDLEAGGDIAEAEDADGSSFIVTNANEF